MNPIPAGIEAYITKRVSFAFRGRTFNFALSQGLFSSADIDAGSRLLLKVFSQMLDTRPPPKRILDAGCGMGVLGICAAAGADCTVRCQDRDELARQITEYNARQNGIPQEKLSAHTEPLLAGDGPWDLILSNLPAKAGKPVLEDFIRRSSGLLNPEGRAVIVVVNPLADFFRSRIEKIIQDETGPGHTVLVYGPSEGPREPVRPGPGFLTQNPAYHRHSGRYEMKKIGYTLDTVYGAADFDAPGGPAQAGAKLADKLGPRLPPASTGLMYEPGQGHFPVWFAAGRSLREYTLAGRNILALEASRHNLRQKVEIRSTVDFHALVGEKSWDFIAAFPEAIPQTDRLGAHWEDLAALLADRGVVLLGFPSAEGERFDRKKPKFFTRLGDVKRKGFRALAYQKTRF